MLLINNAQVTELLTMADCIGAQEQAFRKLPSGGAIHRGRVDMYFPCEREDAYFRWGTMEGANDEYFAIRMKSDIVSWVISVLPTFADLASGAASGRTHPDQVTFYRNNGNQGLQFSAVGGWVYAEARKRKVGREIPTEWFLQDVRD